MVNYVFTGRSIIPEYESFRSGLASSVRNIVYGKTDVGQMFYTVRDEMGEPQCKKRIIDKSAKGNEYWCAACTVLCRIQFVW